MPNDIFSIRPLDAKTMQYCANDVMYLPALRDVYAKKLDSKWRDEAKEESARRVDEACGHTYDPQSEAKKYGPKWGSELDKKLLSLDDWLEQLESDRMDDLERDMLGYDPWDDPWDDNWDDDYPTNSRDAAWDDTFDSCWEK